MIDFKVKLGLDLKPFLYHLHRQRFRWSLLQEPYRPTLWMRTYPIYLTHLQFCRYYYPHYKILGLQSFKRFGTLLELVEETKASYHSCST